MTYYDNEFSEIADELLENVEPHELCDDHPDPEGECIPNDITFCGVIGRRVDILQEQNKPEYKRECYCERCCFNDLEHECTDKVPCVLGGYYKRVGNLPSQGQLFLLSEYELEKLHRLMKLSRHKIFIKRYGISYYPRYNLKRLGAFKTYEDAQIAVYRQTKQIALTRIRKKQYAASAKGRYQIQHRNILISEGLDQGVVKETAERIIKEYYSRLIHEVEDKKKCV